MPSNANYLGSNLFTGQNKSPGHIAKTDALEANDVAQLVNDKSTTKFPQTEPPALPDIPQAGLTSAPGELVGRGENHVRRPKPFGDIDAVKAAAFALKLAFYDVNVDQINTTNVAPSMSYPPKVPVELDNAIKKSPRVGDYKADAPADEKRDFSGAAPFGKIDFMKKEPFKPRTDMTPQNYGYINSGDRKTDDSLSNRYQVESGGALKVALAIPEPIMTDDDWNKPNGDDEYEDTNHLSKRINHTGNLSHVGVAQGLSRGSRGDNPKKRKEGTFVSAFLRNFYAE